MRIQVQILFMLLALLPTSVQGEDWRVEGFAHCVAYTYDYKQDPRGPSIVFKDGSLHKGVIRSATLRLNERQILRLFDAVNSTKEDLGESDCHDSHYAFVFYDLGWKPIGWVEVCFLCGTVMANPKGVPDDIDLDLLARYCKRIGMPVFHDDEGYSRLFRQEQPAEQDAARKPSTAVPE